MGKHMELEKRLCKELDILETKFKTGADMSETDLKRADMILHALKSLATYEAMKEAEEYEMDGYSGRRGRSPYTGRYVSRDEGPGMSGREQIGPRYPYDPYGRNPYPNW